MVIVRMYYTMLEAMPCKKQQQVYRYVTGFTQNVRLALRISITKENRGYISTMEIPRGITQLSLFTRLAKLKELLE